MTAIVGIWKSGVLSSLVRMYHIGWNSRSSKSRLGLIRPVFCKYLVDRGTFLFRQVDSRKNVFKQNLWFFCCLYCNNITSWGTLQLYSGPLLIVTLTICMATFHGRWLRKWQGFNETLRECYTLTARKVTEEIKILCLSSWSFCQGETCGARSGWIFSVVSIL